MLRIFTTIRERRLWYLVAVVQIGIFTTLELAGQLVSSLRERGLLEISMVAALVLTGIGIVMISVRRQSIMYQIGLTAGVIAAFWMVWVRIKTPYERTHLFEYGLVSVLIYQALLERMEQGGGNSRPGVWAVLITSGLGLMDELIQIMIPSRGFDIRDVGFNLLAGAMGVGISVVLTWLEKWWESRSKNIRDI